MRAVSLKQKSSLDIGLENGVGDEDYLRLLRLRLPGILDRHRPEIVVFQAGVDPFEADQLGDLALTKEGLAERDRFVVEESRKRGIPIAGLVGGGYAQNPDDTIELHLNTCRAFLGI